MSLHVNLILDSEKLSGSNISRRFIIHTSLSVIVVLLVFGAVAFALAVRSARQTRAFAEQERKRIDPVYQSVLKQRAELDNIQGLVRLIEGWSSARFDGRGYLLVLSEKVPETVQLTRLTMQQNLERTQPARQAAPTRRTRGARGAAPQRTAQARVVSQWVGNIYLSGRAVGRDADSNVLLMNTAFRTNEYFKTLLARSEVKHFAADSDDPANARVFDIECGLRPRRIE